MQETGSGLLRRTRPTEGRLPDQLLAAALLGTAAIQAGVLLNPASLLFPVVHTLTVLGLAFRVLAGSWLLLTVGRPRRAGTRLAVLLVDCLLLVGGFALIPATVTGILVLLLARLPFVCSVLPRRQVVAALALILLGPAAVLVHRAATTDVWQLATLWLYLVAAFLIGGSTLRVTRALAAAEARALRLAVRAQASEAQAQASAAAAREQAARAEELAARREHEAVHDTLTGLPNRLLYADRLATAVSHAQRSGGDVAVLLLDLDRFKLVNDSRGHAAGDELLVAIGDRLREHLRSSDTLARLGGDEFAVIVQDVRDPDDALVVAAHLHQALRAPFVLRDGGAGGAEGGPGGPGSVYVTASCGVAFARGRSEDLGVVLREADAAMYKAKARGRGLVEVFDDSMGAVAERRLHLETQLRHDLETGSGALTVAFQPVVEPAGGRIVGVEALARWSCARYGAVGPDEFIAVAEDAGLIHDLGRSVLRIALEQSVWWHRLRPDLEVAVNVSPVQLHRADLADEVGHLLARAGVSPQLLCLEVTEGVLLDPHGASAANLRALHELGVKLAVDDFGAGYSSLSQLRRFPLDVLKADRSFVDDPPILRAVADLATALGAQALAEGVETPEQRRQLVELGYARAQGYLWARPQPADAVTEALRAAGGALQPSPAGHP
ncbi:diguanylate cyclase (GGDEF)-like protein [Kineococcus xinjiangensis]|uniref:Diguanylate cyclase (GGDEF)-like protein n=1 Tax=Kineococcus xinjiangensis TaxID=512762 RepID=A0A2S6IJ75_9ACTN|nr:EAL domain-containing protein [Kineococcus xinjiangensis]PPK94241.1 diguanylate cyclase (GGDEF)-like protein [Kineococcus xinjiangensis]